VNTKTFVVGFVAAMAAVLAVSTYMTWTVEPASKVIVARKSPDGRYKAVRERLTRKGDPKFCADSIGIFLAVYPDSFVESNKVYEVYAGPCATATGRTPLPALKWLSKTSLRITYTPPPKSDAVKLKMRPMDASKYVHIAYVAR
jgi:hypothetical protein